MLTRLSSLTSLICERQGEDIDVPFHGGHDVINQNHGKNLLVGPFVHIGYAVEREHYFEEGFEIGDE